MVKKENLKKIDEYIWEIPVGYRSNMRVPGRIYASEGILDDILDDESLEQVVNVATLPGIQKYSLAMPDIHEGYGAPVGSVFALDKEEGVISPGSVGYDICCGIRVIRTGVSYEEIKDQVPRLTEELYKEVPSGVGRGGPLKLKRDELEDVLRYGVEKVVEWGYGEEDDLVHCESGGRLEEANISKVSDTAKRRGSDQIGTLGAGNHFVEVQRIDKIFDFRAAELLGLKENEVTIMIHCGSRGLGHQVATDYIKIMSSVLNKYGIELPDRQLACAPFNSPEGEAYFGAMAAAANFAWANRQLITHHVRRAWSKVFGGQMSNINSQLSLIYDVAHNIAKVEKYKINGKEKELVVHRKGATRAFPPGHLETPELYKEIGQPVLIPGSMGTSSFILVGQEGSMEKSFGSSCHGAGRVMSRTQAKKKVWGEDLKKNLEQKGISVQAGSMSSLAEEAPSAYKDVEDVVRVVHNLGLAKRVVRMKPMGVIKG